MKYSFLLILTLLVKVLSGQQNVTQIQPETNEFFGSDVTISDSHAIMSYSSNTLASGLVYTYKYTNGDWLPENILTASDMEVGDSFGESIEVFNNELIIGAPSVDTWTSNSQRAGKVYSFKLVNDVWLEGQIIGAPSGFELSKFGQSVYLNDNYLLVGAPEKNFFNGAAVLFKKVNDNWELSNIFENNDFSISSFGETVYVGDNWLGISGYKYQGNIDVKIIKLYQYNNNNWELKHEILEDEVTTSTAIPFGNLQSFEIFEDELVVGYRNPANEIFNVPSRGGAFSYVYNDVEWEKTHVFSNPTFEDYDLGNCIAFNNNYLVLGASRNHESIFNIDNTILIYSKDDENLWNELPLMEIEVETIEGEALRFKSDISSRFAILGSTVNTMHSGIVYIIDFEKGTTSNLNISTKTNFDIYPNPSSEIFRIETELEDFTVSILNSKGQILDTFLNEKEINVSMVPSAIYFIKVCDLDTNSCDFTKLLKQ